MKGRSEEFFERVRLSTMQLVWSSQGVFKHPGDVFPLGTCFMVADGLAATAHHNVDEARKKLRNAGERVPEDEHTFGLGCVELDTGATFMVTESLRFNNSDLTLLRVERHDLMSEVSQPPLCILRTTSPAVGEECYVYGFGEQDTELDEHATTEVGHDCVALYSTAFFARTSVAEILASWPGFINYECVKLTPPPAPPGTSGGPVIDLNGRVFGLVSTSLEASHTIVSPWSAIGLTSGSLPDAYAGKVGIRTQDGDEIAVYIDNSPFDPFI